MCLHSSIYTSSMTTGEILSDRTKSGKERPWRKKKLRSQLTAEVYEKAGLAAKAKRMQECAETMVFKGNGAELKLYQAYFCKVRLCPMCNWRRSLKIGYQNKQIVEEVNKQEKVRWLFLTLTIKNTVPERLPETLKTMFRAFNNLTKRKPFQKAVRGYFRALEVTKNRETGEYHPHFHVLLCVVPSYFKKKDYYIKQSEWTSLWQQVMKLDYTPIVHIQRVKPKKNLDDLKDYENEFKKTIEEQAALNEVSKYPVKDSDVIQGNEVTDENIETVLALDNALAYKRLIGYGGILKEMRAKLAMDDAEDGDLIKITGDDEVANGTFDVIAKWHIGLKNYVIE